MEWWLGILQKNAYTLREKKNLSKYFNSKFIQTQQAQYKLPFTSTITRETPSVDHYLVDTY